MEMGKAIRLTRREYRRVLQAIGAAVDNRLALIDAHRVKLVRRPGGLIEHAIPKEHQPLAARCRRDIKAWRSIAAKLNGAFL